MGGYAIPINVVVVEDDRLPHLASELAIECPLWGVRVVGSMSAAIDVVEDLAVDVLIARRDVLDGSPGGAQRLRRLNPQLAMVGLGNPATAEEADGADHGNERFVTDLSWTTSDLRALRSTVERGVTLRHRLQDPALRKLLDEIEELPSPPGIVIELGAAMSEADVAMQDIARILERDPAMVAGLLRVANSAELGLSRQIATVVEALPYLGLENVYSFVASTQLTHALRSPSPTMSHEMGLHSAHSLEVARLAKAAVAARSQNVAFVGGLLHDIGLLALMACAPAHYLALREELRHRGGRSLEACELEVLGAGHAAIGAHLAEAWNLPLVLVEAIARSHDADAPPRRTPPVVQAVFLAEQACGLGEPATWWEPGRPPIDEIVRSMVAGMPPCELRTWWEQRDRQPEDAGGW